MSKVKIISLIIGSIICGWIGFQGYNYFFNKSESHFIVSGIKNDNSYAGDITCLINGEHSYKVKKT